MKACINCHQKKEQLNDKGLCEDCFDAMTPEAIFSPAYDFKLGKNNNERKVQK